MSLPPGVNRWGSGVARCPRTWREAAPHGRSINHQEGFPTVYLIHIGVYDIVLLTMLVIGAKQGALRDTFRSKLHAHGLKRPGTSSYGMSFYGGQWQVEHAAPDGATTSTSAEALKSIQTRQKNVIAKKLHRRGRLGCCAVVRPHSSRLRSFFISRGFVTSGGENFVCSNWLAFQKW